MLRKLERLGFWISHVRSIKCLGISLYDKFIFSCHIIKLRKTLLKVKGLIFKLSQLLSPGTLPQIYCSLFYSRMSYCISVWGGCYSTNTSRMDRINKSAISVFSNNLAQNVRCPGPYRSS